MTRQEKIKLNKRYTAFTRFCFKKMNNFINNNQLEELTQWKESQEYKMLDAKLNAIFNQLYQTKRI